MITFSFPNLNDAHFVDILDVMPSLFSETGLIWSLQQLSWDIMERVVFKLAWWCVYLDLVPLQFCHFFLIFKIVI